MSEETIQVLLVEDDSDDMLLVREMLNGSEQVEFDLQCTKRLSEASELLESHTFDVILLDLSLPDSQGISTFYELRKDALNTPVVVLTEINDEKTAIETMRAGAQDYLSKEDANSNVLIRALRYAIERHRLEDKLSHALGRLDREFEIIANVQDNLLPSQIPGIPGYEIVTYYQPAEWAGGDYFDFLPIVPDSTGILLADVSGRGAPAAVLMAMTRVIVHEEDNWDNPSDVLGILNEQLAANIPPGRFVTANYGVLNHESNSFRFACAGHTPPLTYCKSSNTAQLLEVESRLPLGIEADTVYKSSEVMLEHGQTLILYTDGITTAQDSGGSAFGQKRLAKALQDAHPQTPDTTRDTILEALREHTGQRDLSDDTTLVIVQAGEKE